jgi:cell division septal protein FtsQ
MWGKRKYKNRRMGHINVLDVKLRSEQVRATRLRLAALTFGALFGTVFGLYVVWRTGEWALDQLVYENPAFAIRIIDVQTDGVVAADQLRRWAGVKTGENLLALDLASVKRNLEMAPMIGSASVERILPRTLRIRVEERQPVAQINVPKPKTGGGIEVAVFQLDAYGYVIVPLDPRQRTTPLNQLDNQLPVLTGVSAPDLQPGRRVESPQVQAALGLISAFDCSPMAGLVDLRRIDVASGDVLVAVTGQGSMVTFGMHDLDWQLRRWREIYESGRRMNRAILSLDLAVTNNTPVSWAEASAAPATPAKLPQTQRNRKRHV